MFQSLLRSIARMSLLITCSFLASLMGVASALLTLSDVEQEAPIGFRSGMFVAGTPEASGVPATLNRVADETGIPIGITTQGSHGSLTAVELYVTGPVQDGWLRYDEHGGYPGVIPWYTTTVHPMEELPADRVVSFYYFPVDAASAQGVRDRLAAEGFEIERTAEAPALWEIILRGQAFVGPAMFAMGVVVFALSLHELRHRRRSMAAREIHGHSSGAVMVEEITRIIAAWFFPSVICVSVLFSVRQALMENSLPIGTLMMWFGTPIVLVLIALLALTAYVLGERGVSLAAVMSRRFIARRELLPVLCLIVMIALGIGSVAPMALGGGQDAALAMRLTQLGRSSSDAQTISYRSSALETPEASEAVRERLLPVVAQTRREGHLLVRDVNTMSSSPPALDGIAREEHDAVMVSQGYLDYFSEHDPQISQFAQAARQRTEATLFLSERVSVADEEAFARSWSEYLTEVNKLYDPSALAIELGFARFGQPIRLPDFIDAGFPSHALSEAEAIIVIPDHADIDIDRWFTDRLLGGGVAFVDPESSLRNEITTPEIAPFVSTPSSVEAGWFQIAAHYWKQYLSAWAGMVLAIGTAMLGAWSAAISWVRVRGRRAILLFTRGVAPARIGRVPLAWLALLTGAGTLAGVPITLPFGVSTPASIAVTLCLTLMCVLLLAGLTARSRIRRERMRIMRTL